MAWTAIFDQASGRLISVGDVVGSLPSGVSTLTLAGPPDLATQMWDETSRSFVSRPAKVFVDRIQDLADDPVLSTVWSRLTAAQRTTLRNRLVTLLGKYRFHSTSSSTDLG